MPDDPPAPDEIFSAFFLEVGILAQLSRTLFSLRLPPGISVSQFTVLNHLVRVRDGGTPLELARAFQVPKTSMTHSLNVLERHGLPPTPWMAGRNSRSSPQRGGRSCRHRAPRWHPTSAPWATCFPHRALPGCCRR